MSIPYVKKDEKGIPTLYVSDRPFLCRSGEIHNSSASNLVYMKEEVWPKLRGLNMNSVIIPIYWELIEKTEGVYDFSLVDGLIDQAREEEKKIIFLWFGLWKNSESMYVPEWMKRDTETYYHVEKANGESINTISPMCVAAIEKDKAAFTAVMKHIRQVDEKENTVIVFQIENEIGILGCECDYSERAREQFQKEIPTEMAELFGRSGDWKTAFGDDAEEYFMSYIYAKAIEEITKAGKEAYDLPCYANAWLEQYPWFKGSYPTGGPVRNVHTIWKAFTPSLFTIGPDIYVLYCADVMDEYTYEGNPLFVPEIRKDAVAASYCLYAFLAKNAICFSPFGIEDLALDPAAMEKPPMEVMIALNIDPTAFDITGSKEKLAAVYKIIKNIEPLYLKYRGTEHLKAFIRHGENDFGTFVQFLNYDIAAAYAPRAAAHPLGCFAAFELSEDKFLVLGMECTLTFRQKAGENKHVAYIRLEEGELIDGEWNAGRVLNGDENMAIKFGDMPKAYMVELYKY